MGGTTSKESPSGGSESRGGVQHVTTNTPAAESDLGKQVFHNGYARATDLAHMANAFHLTT